MYTEKIYCLSTLKARADREKGNRFSYKTFVHNVSLIFR